MLKVSVTWAPLVVQAVSDAIAYQTLLLRSETLRNRADYEEHLMQLELLLDYLKREYEQIEDEAGIPLEKLL